MKESTLFALILTIVIGSVFLLGAVLLAKEITKQDKAERICENMGYELDFSYEPPNSVIMRCIKINGKNMIEEKYIEVK